ncbi:glutaredoxin domain-containing protein [uncultured Croceitalea sp.]|uniref:glutaredoxin family protein n=1 Tax=uncultured Croceitalea sp. TaxID=1798908 RepID=UPI0033058D04
MTEPRLQLYGTGWCLKSTALRNYLQSKWIAFDDFNVENDADAELRVRALYNGELKFPTVIKGKNHLKNPTISELNAFIKK